jgi:hypothetical protein
MPTSPRLAFQAHNAGRARQQALRPSLSADADAADYDPDTMMVTVIVVTARCPPCHAGNAAGSQRPPYDGLRLISVNGDTGSPRHLDRVRRYGKHRSHRADQYDWF